MKKILCIGPATVDALLFPIDQLPSPGTLQLVDQSVIGIGGCGVNCAVDLANIGVNAALCCKLGKDVLGDFIVKTVQAAGVNTDGVSYSENISTSFSTVCINSNGERSFLYNAGSSAELKMKDIPQSLLKDNEYIFVTGAMLLWAFDGKPCAELLCEAKKMGKITFMDTAWDAQGIWMPKIRPSLPYLDYFMPSYDETVHLTGEKSVGKIASLFQEYGAKNIVIKLGKDGAYCRLENGTEFWHKGFCPDVMPIDTTGAGDSFCAGFLTGLSLGRTPYECLQLGNAVGTHCIMHMGATSGIPSLAQLDAFIENNFEKEQ